MTVILEPATEIHLARTGARQVRLSVKFLRSLATPTGGTRPFNDFAVEDITSGCAVEIDPVRTSSTTTPVVIARYDPATRHLTVTDEGVGSAPFRVRTGPPLTLTINGILHVHRTFDEWWFGNNHLTVPKDPGAFHTQASIYAHFDGDASHPKHLGVIADITGHGYVALATSAADVFVIDDESRGRIQGRRTGDAELRGTALGHTERVPVRVVNFYGELVDPGNPNAARANPVLEPVAGHFQGSPEQKHNLLFVAEGFREADRELFDRLVVGVTQRLFSAPRHSPYRHLRRDFNVWKAFHGVSEQGITYGPQVTGYNVGGVGGLGNEHAILQARASFLGLYYPRRATDQQVPAATLELGEARVIGDPRRFPLERTWVHAFEEYLGSLANGSVRDGAGPDYLIGRFWRAGAKDAGLVCIIVYDDSFYALNGGIATEGGQIVPIPSPFRAINIGHFILLSFQGPEPYLLGAHAPGPVFLLDPARPLHGGAARPFQWRLNRDYHSVSSPPSLEDAVFIDVDAVDKLTNTAAHELGHSFVLLDEYEEISGHGGLYVNPDDNLLADRDIMRLTGSLREIDPERIKWSRLHRVTKSERIVRAEWNLTDITNLRLTLTLTLETNAVSRWVAEQSANTRVYVREFRRLPWRGQINYNYGHVDYEHVRQLPRELPAERWLVVFSELPIVEIRAAANQIVLRVERRNIPVELASMPSADLRTLLSTLLGPGSVLYVPRTRRGQILQLIEPDVMDFMMRDPRHHHQPLSSNFDPSTSNHCSPLITGEGESTNFPHADLLRRLGNRAPAHSFQIIGAYEGGGHYHCGVFRPAGACKMRDHYLQGRAGEFCFVCKYLIVNRINPRRLEDIESEYPERRQGSSGP